MSRLFIAIPLPERINKKIKNLQHPIEGIKWQRIAQMHLTLCFLGDTPASKAEKLQAQLQIIEEEAFSLSLTEWGGFPDLKHPKVLWIGVEKSQPLQRLHHQVKDVCRQNEVAFDDKPFVPHITLGRVKKSSPKVKKFIDRSESLAAATFRVTRFVLFESHLSPKGARHEILREYKLSTLH